MKGKTLISLVVLAALFVALTPPIATASPTKIYFDPVELTGEDCVLIGTEFTLTVRVDTVEDLYGYTITINWDPLIFDRVSGPTEGKCLEDPDGHQGGPYMTAFMNEGIVDGQVKGQACVRLGTVPGADVPPCDNDFFTIRFRVERATFGTWITMTNTILARPDKTEIPHTVQNFYFECPPPPPTPPTALFTPEHCEMVYVGSTVELCALGSLPGYDVEPSPGHSTPITEYKWEIDIGNDGSVELTLYGATVDFLCEAPGDVGILLTVTAEDMIPPTDPRYVPTDTEFHVIHQITKPVGVVIDVYTQEGGIGPGINPDTGEQWPYPTAWADAYAPQEEVTVYAKVTYNDDPVQNKPVGFEVKDETGTAVLFRTAFTNDMGIATINFRLIWECDKTFDGKFEVWEIWATVSVSEIEKKDVCKFRYGWKVQIEGIDVPFEVYKCMMVPIILDLNNICYTPQTVCVTVVIYDDCGVPIGLAVIPEFTVPADDGLTPEMTIHIPKWAYIGLGTVYANLYTRMPQLCGVPVCPEASVPISIGRS